MENEVLKKENKFEAKPLISWTILVLFFVCIVLIYIFFRKEPELEIEPTSLEELQRITEEANNNLENPTNLGDLEEQSNLNSINNSQNRTPLEELQRLSEQNSL
jgi:flagellar biosynthesis/type III secretory pathway M-ring protein FliF/YscJ